jgi:hypothetical protein
VLQFVVDHLERAIEIGVLVHDLPDAIDQALLDGGFKGTPARTGRRKVPRSATTFFAAS